MCTVCDRPRLVGGRSRPLKGRNWERAESRAAAESRAPTDFLADPSDGFEADPLVVALSPELGRRAVELR
jgi:hypothetical protein